MENNLTAKPNEISTMNFLDRFYLNESLLCLDLKRIRNLTLRGNVINFFPYKTELDNHFLRIVDFKDSNNNDLIYLKDLSDDPLFKLSKQISSPNLNKLYNGKFVFSCIGTDRKHELVFRNGYYENVFVECNKLLVCISGQTKRYEMYLKQKNLNISISTSENDIFFLIKNEKILKKLDSNLYELKNLTLDKTPSLICTTKKFVLVYFQETDSVMNFYDFDLNYVKSVTHGDNESFIHLPRTVKEIFVNNKFYFFQENDGTITVVNKDDGTFFKKINPVLKNRIVKITNNMIIMTQKDLAIELMDFNGDVFHDVTYNMPSNDFISYFDVLDNIYLMNLKNFKLFNSKI
ncbi:unnamed protein product [Brachionus calyciflorus]|uniref:Uncharacterized protein n=1 Tax=Brachionus calyciflorus TaxID=104777 RepID=A0A814EUY5_9BILA|nr:unnamed protein product [Brachionus calyciflorus]